MERHTARPTDPAKEASLAYPEQATEEGGVEEGGEKSESKE